MLLNYGYRSSLECSKISISFLSYLSLNSNDLKHNDFFGISEKKTFKNIFARNSGIDHDYEGKPSRSKGLL